ncbi:primase 1D-like protein [Candidatus Accumulibacter propinquus]|uniref:primase 1D-like protein n=1 Tax=Candidatus Accumulibacter propinquus TaxID=2954380 RepID=UPI003DA8C783
MISQNHPFHFLSSLFRKEGATCEFSKYVYAPDSLLDEREIISVSSDDLTETWIESTLSSLRPDQELAIHSKVSMAGRNWHIPLIDFSLEKDFSHDVFDRMCRYLPKSVMLNMAVYSSGRSFHAYSTTLLTPKEWYVFMGRLLLINQRDVGDVIDTRWVGHRLIGGYGSLRWSNNSGQYLGLPTKVRFP